jgi:hypothetical protein
VSVCPELGRHQYVEFEYAKKEAGDRLGCFLFDPEDGGDMFL